MRYARRNDTIVAERLSHVTLTGDEDIAPTP